MNFTTYNEKFVQALKLRNFSLITISCYSSMLKRFIETFKERSDPRHVSEDEIKQYLSKSTSVSHLKQNISAQLVMEKILIKN